MLLQRPPGQVDTSPLAGKVPGCLEPEKVSASEALWLLPVPEAVRFCSPHSHLCRLVSEGSGNQDGSPRCSGKAFPGGADTSPLAGKVPGYLEPKTWSASEALWLLPVLEVVSFCSPHSHLRRLVLEESGNQDGSPRCCSKTSIMFLGVILLQFLKKINSNSATLQPTVVTYMHICQFKRGTNIVEVTDHYLI